jgi:hypothetical protein
LRASKRSVGKLAADDAKRASAEQSVDRYDVVLWPRVIWTGFRGSPSNEFDRNSLCASVLDRWNAEVAYCLAPIDFQKDFELGIIAAHEIPSQLHLIHVWNETGFFETVKPDPVHSLGRQEFQAIPIAQAFPHVSVSTDTGILLQLPFELGLSPLDFIQLRLGLGASGKEQSEDDNPQ